MGEGEIVFIDANIFLELFLGDIKANICADFLKQVKNGVRAMTSDFVIYSCIIQLERKVKLPEVIEKFILFIGELTNNLDILRPSFQEMLTALTISKKYNLDFDDGFIVSCMLDNGINTLVSLDKHFDEVEGILRVEPK
ncbi:type II toxin-antitoxin system VapC family toxin [Candidatus Woesearchaeota archaeon]|nr:type II toxin-antitoxin system VapC family toxin [Candidatus Woesearchaeota archaeon]